MLISQKIEKVSAEYSDSRRSVALYLLKAGLHVAGRSIGDVANDIGVSKATLVRFGKQLGYSGWQEFHTSWTHELERSLQHDAQANMNYPFSATSSSADIIAAVSAVHAETARETALLQNPEDLERAASFLLEAKRILLGGISVNKLCLGLFQHKLMQIGIESMLPEAADMGHVVRLLQHGDCAVLVSYTGEGSLRSPMLHVPYLQAHGVRIIALTSEGGNYLADNADALLPILSREALFAKIATFSTEESIQCLLDLLYSFVFARSYEHNLSFKTATSRDVEFNRETGTRA